MSAFFPGDASDPDRLRQLVLKQALLHVPFKGWEAALSTDCLAQAGVNPILAAEAFPQGTSDLLNYFAADGDERMAKAWHQQYPDDKGMTSRITHLTQLRLIADCPYRESVRAMLAWFALPPRGSKLPQMLAARADTIWRCAGDRSVDFNFYTKRLLLAGVISSSTLFWLNDDSPDCVETCSFVERRIADALRVGKLTGRIGSTLGAVLNLKNHVRV